MNVHCAPKSSDTDGLMANPVSVARSLKPLLVEHAAETERNRRIPDVVIDAIADAGLFKLVMPRRAGGGGGTQMQMLEVVAELGKGCMSTAWVVGLLMGVTGVAACMPPAIRDSIFVTGDERVFGVTVPTGTATPVPGGYRITGSWSYSSGCLHADWAMLGVKLLGADGDVAGIGQAFLPMSADGVSIKDTWHVAGVAGSGSNTVILQDTFVPEHMVIGSLSDLNKVWLPQDAIESRERWLAEIAVPLGVIGPSFGAAEAMLEIVTAGINKKTVTHWKYPIQSDSEVLLEQLGLARMEIESAWLHVGRAASVNDIVVQERAASGNEMARSQADCGYATILLRSAADRLMNIAGSSAFATANPLQRFWRDLNVGTRHAFLNAHASMELYGRVWAGKASNNIQFDYADAEN